MITEVRSTSPGGQYAVSVCLWEARMSLWIHSPTLADATTGEELFSFLDQNWSLDLASWLNDSTVVLTLRKYPGGHTPTAIEATIDCVEKTALVGSVRMPSLNQLEEQLDKSLSWNPSPNTQSVSCAVGWRTWFSGFFGK